MDSWNCERREFLRVLGYTALSLQLVPFAGACAAEEPAPADSLTVHSSRNSKLGDWVAHTHLLYVPLHWFRSPPAEGVSLDTTRTFLHRHTVDLTAEQLTLVGQGGSIQVKDTSNAHTYRIALS